MRSEPDAMARAAGFSMLWAAAEETITNPGSAASGSGFRRVESGSVKASYWTRFFLREPFGLDCQAALYESNVGICLGSFGP
jgi:hypothetical protein